MRAERNSHPEDDGKPKPLHRSGGFPEAVRNPSDGAAHPVEERANDNAYQANGARGGLLVEPGELHDDEQQANQQQRHADSEAQPMKPAGQSIHSSLLRFTPSRCLLMPFSARVEAFATLASFALLTWVVLGGIA